MARNDRANQPHESRTSPLHRVTLRRGPHRWGFSFRASDAGLVLNRLRELALDPDCPLDHEDAQTLRHAIESRLRHDTMGSPAGPPPTPGSAAR